MYATLKAIRDSYAARSAERKWQIDRLRELIESQ